jgi:hypothetical protein
VVVVKIVVVVDVGSVEVESGAVVVDTSVVVLGPTGQSQPRDVSAPTTKRRQKSASLAETPWSPLVSQMQPGRHVSSDTAARNV